MESIVKTKYELLLMKKKQEELRKLVENENTGWSLKNIFWSNKVRSG